MSRWEASWILHLIAKGTEQKTEQVWRAGCLQVCRQGQLPQHHPPSTWASLVWCPVAHLVFGHDFGSSLGRPVGHWPLYKWQTCCLELVARLPLTCSLALEGLKPCSMSSSQYISVREPSLVPGRAISLWGLRHCPGRIPRRLIFPSANIPLSPQWPTPVFPLLEP